MCAADDSSIKMEGVLLKWTNYLSGWQPRYFILEDGILSYFQSQEDVNSSCKGSIKVSASDIIAHPTDHTRMDIIIPGEAHYHLKTAMQQDRQLWLVALGTCKACSYNNTSVKFSSNRNHVANYREGGDLTGEELLKTKKSELLMYRDILTQQLFNIKMTLKAVPPDLNLLNESTTLVNATCESLVNTLEDCMQLVDLNSFVKSREGSLSPTGQSKSSFHKGSAHWGSQPMPRMTSTDKSSMSRGNSEEKDTLNSFSRSISLSSTTSDSNKSNRRQSTSSRVSRTSITSETTPTKSTVVPSTQTNNNSVVAVVDTTIKERDDEDDSINSTRGNSIVNGDLDSGDQSVATEITFDIRLPTFFTEMTTSFVDIKLTPDLEIPTVQFLDASRCFVSIFDKLNQPAFVIGKLDIAGNIRKIHQKYISAPEKFTTLQKMVSMEMTRKEVLDVNSATVALLWLCKSLEYAHIFILDSLKQDGSSNCDLDGDQMRGIALQTYGKVLKKYHGLVVRSAFSIALSSTPPIDRLISCLATEVSNYGDPNFRKSLKKDLEDYLSGLGAILNLLKEVFDINGLKIDENV